MRNRLTVLLCCIVCLAVGLSAGSLLGKEEFVRRLNLPGRGDDRPYNHAIVAGETIYVAWTIGVDPETGKPPADPMTEAKLMLEGMRRKLALAGAAMDDLVSVQVFCSDLTLYQDFNKVYRTYFDKKFPVRAFVGAGPLLWDARFEINGIAVKR
jgi:enamine deaminase RidA (YjgF/YER057c/UK114 family)